MNHEFKSGVELSLFDQIRHRCLSAALRGSPGRDDTPGDPQYDIHVRLIGKRVVVFLLVLTELFASLTAEALQAKID